MAFRKRRKRYLGKALRRLSSKVHRDLLEVSITKRCVSKCQRAYDPASLLRPVQK